MQVRNSKKKAKSKWSKLCNSFVPYLDSRHLGFCLGKEWRDKHRVNLLWRMNIMQISNIHKFTHPRIYNFQRYLYNQTIVTPNSQKI